MLKIKCVGISISPDFEKLYASLCGARAGHPLNNEGGNFVIRINKREP